MVSVVIPVYNVAPYIEECLASVGRQTYPDVECVIVDDCGTDGSMSLVSNFIDKYSGTVRFHVVRQLSNSGLSASRNLGMSKSAGDFVFFLDGDDVITDDCLSRLVDVQHQNDADCVVGSYRQVYNNGMKKDYVVRKPHGNLLMASVVEWQATAWNMLLRKRFLKTCNLQFEPGILHEDLLWNFYLLMNKPVMGYSSNITYFYYVRPESIMTSINAAVVSKRFISYQIILQQMENKRLQMQLDKSDATMIESAFFVERTARMMARMMLELGCKKEAYWLFCYARNHVYLPWYYCFLSSGVILGDRCKIFYRLIPERLSFRLFLWLTL